MKARSFATRRFINESWTLNAQIPSRALRTVYQPETKAMNFLHSELDKEHISARGLHKIMRTAWSIADLSQHPKPTLEDTQRAFALREGVGI